MQSAFERTTVPPPGERPSAGVEPESTTPKNSNACITLTHALIAVGVITYVGGVLATLVASDEQATRYQLLVHATGVAVAMVALLIAAQTEQRPYRLRWLLLAACSALYLVRPLRAQLGWEGTEHMWMASVGSAVITLLTVAALTNIALLRRSFGGRGMRLEMLAVLLAVTTFQLRVSIIPGITHWDNTHAQLAYSLFAPTRFILVTALILTLVYTHEFKGLAARLLVISFALDIIVNALTPFLTAGSNPTLHAAVDIVGPMTLLWAAAAHHRSRDELNGKASHPDHGWNPLSGAAIGVAMLLPVLGTIAGPPPSMGEALTVIVLSGSATFLIVHRTRMAISNLANAERSSDERARLDPLTGLLNRYGLQTMVTSGSHGPLGLAYIDIDRFKLLNDLNGHSYGDELLRKVAERLMRAGEPVVAVARLGGDEYAILFTAGENEPETVNQIDALIAATFAELFTIDDAPIRATASAGIAPPSALARARHTQQFADRHLLAELIRLADMAQYQAKHEGGAQTRVYDESIERELNRRAAIMQALEHELDDVLDLHYQGIVDICGGNIVGAEALCRMHVPGLGRVAPDEFIQLAESTGYIDRVGEWVFRRATADLAANATDLPDTFRLSINLSPLQLRSISFLNDLLLWAQTHRGLMRHVRLEITESGFVGTEGVERIASLRRVGYEIAIDDFGSQFASLSNLYRYKTDVLKLDRGFVANLEDPTSQALVSTVIELAHVLDLHVVGEGIETTEQAHALAQLGCDFGQGFLWHRPAPGLHRLLNADLNDTEPYSIATRPQRAVSERLSRLGRAASA